MTSAISIIDLITALILLLLAAGMDVMKELRKARSTLSCFLIHIKNNGILPRARTLTNLILDAFGPWHKTKKNIFHDIGTLTINPHN